SFDKLSDVSGTYVGLDFSGKYESGFAKYEVLNNSLVQQTPASIAQLNDIENRSFGFREMTYNAIIKGAKGIVMWGDGVAAADGKTLVFVESRAWWTDIPKLRRELDQLLPALEKPPSKNLALFTTDPEVRFDIRQLDNQFVLIMLNSGAAQKLVTFVSPTYRINQITNYFDDSTISRPGTNSFSLTIPAHSTAVYSLSASEVKLEGLPPAPLPPTFN
ncbi:MAG TPA: hypothetical protein VM553_11935, partial [Dongiaceae bacterium]|nr:hypothetical protein [Dongiaceae bacterium]